LPGLRAESQKHHPVQVSGVLRNQNAFRGIDFISFARVC
jgi:hypothetical protein